MNQLQDETKKDDLLQKVTALMNSIKWKHEKDKAVQPYKNISDELSVTDDGILFRKTRIIMPANLQDKCNLLRSKIWFPKMDEKIEHYIKSCPGYAVSTNTNKQTSLSMPELPDVPWQHISIDFCGPVDTGEYI